MSDKPKFTEGPWHRSFANGRVVERHGKKIATAHPTPDDPPRAWANASLILAAPDLYAALKAVRDNAKDDSPELWKQVDAAISKAEGKQ